MAPSWHSSAWTACFFVFAEFAQASFPLSQDGPSAELKEEEGVTFDPLGVAAVLYNPRADKSACRLYTQYDLGLFTWPHMTMIGGTLPPMQMLVEHFTAPMKWINPAVKICTKNATTLPIQCDIPGSVYQELSWNLSNDWLSNIISFRPSAKPTNDFLVVYIEEMFPQKEQRKKQVRESLHTGWWWLYTLSLNLIGLVNGMMLMAGMVCGILVADIWAFTLFFLYGIHWIAGALVSSTQMIQLDTPSRKEPAPGDYDIRYAVYQREEGGTVVFKAPKAQLEMWARSKWRYNHTWRNDIIHWAWILTGTLSGFSSVACMVNMRGYMQLAFLGVLVYSSAADIVATRVAFAIHLKSRGEVVAAKVRPSNTRTEAIIRATLEIDPRCRLTGLDWVALDLLPSQHRFSKEWLFY